MLIKEVAECASLIQLLNGLNFCIQKNVVQDIVKRVQMSLTKAFATIYVIDQSVMISMVVGKIEPGTITGNKPVSVKGFVARNSFIKLIKQFLESFLFNLIASLDHG